MKPKFAQWLKLLLLLPILLNFAPFTHAGKPSPLPNIVIIFTDDQGYADVGVFGAKGFQTPNLKRLRKNHGVYIGVDQPKILMSPGQETCSHG